MEMYLDTSLQFRANKNLSLVKVRRVEASVHRLRSTNRLALGLIRKIQVAVVQTVALYGAEL